MDVVCLQETHLVTLQEFGFRAHTPKYEWFFLHGVSNSGGVCIGIRGKLNRMPSVIDSIKGYALVVKLGDLSIITIYAPPNGALR